MTKKHHPIGNLGKYAHPKKPTESNISPKQANLTGPTRHQVGNVQPRMPHAHSKGKRH